MCNLLLKPLIQKFKNQEMAVFPIIYEEFKKLIRLYAGKLCYEDATADLNLFFVELLFSIDLSRFSDDDSFGLKRYIAVCVRNHYITLSIKASKNSEFTFPIFENTKGYSEEWDDKLLLTAVMSGLSNKQKDVLIHRYIYGYSDCEISQILGITRQAVNGIKRRAIQNIRQLIR